MHNTKQIFVVVVCSLALAAFTPAAVADFSWELSYEFSGETPPSGPPIASFTTIDNGPNYSTVLLEMDSWGLSGAEKITGWYFNLDEALNLANLDAVHFDGQTGSFDKGRNDFKADGDGKYDIRFSFDSGQGQNDPEFPADKQSVWEFSYSGGGLLAEDFVFLSLPDGGHGPFYTAAHVQGVGLDGDDSGWVTVPAPGAAMLGLLGLGLVGSVRRRVA